MAINKKKIPLVVLQLIQPIFKMKSPFYKFVEPGNSLLKLVDTDESSDYFFEIESYKIEASKKYLQIKFKPQGKTSINMSNIAIDFKLIEEYLKNWVSLLEEYEKVDLNEDPILKKYEEEFFTDYKIIDEDADTVSFDLNQQDYLFKYLGKVQSVLEKHKNDKNKNDLYDINKQVEDLKKDLTQQTKNEIMKNLSQIWAKIRKVGYPILKDTLLQFRNEFIKQLVQKVISG